jgi:hypothetical protein
MSGFYRFEFVHGPHDGLAVEGDTMVAPRLHLPTQPGAVVDSSAQSPAALYELSVKALRWDEGGPQAVLRYEFRGSPRQAARFDRLRSWLKVRGGRVARWLMAPVSYPMSTRLP